MEKIYLTIKYRRSAGPRRHLCLLLTFILFAGLNPQELSANTLTGEYLLQGTSVRGKVTDESGSPLPGVNIIEQGTTNGTVTDADGVYNLTVRSGEAVLVYSFVGTVTQQVHVGDRSQIDIQLASDAATLSEVVVVGYGTQEKRDVTGAVATIKSDEFNRGIINSPEQLLQGKVAGVNVTSASGEPGAIQSITVRGPGSIRTVSTPLFVVDGLALDNSATGGGTNPLNFLNPQDIESIDVLKDASATAIYGARGANGVIMITTKKGKAGRSAISYSANMGISNLARKIDVYDADEFRLRVAEANDDGLVTDLGSSTDWQDVITRTAYTQNHNLSLSGGAEKLTYYASLGLQDQEGILKGSDLKRYTGRININQKLLKDRVSVDMNLSASNTLNNRPPIGSLIGGALSLNPTYPAYDANGEPSVFADVTNPLIRLNLNQDITSTTRILGNISPSFEIIKGLVYKLNVGVDHSSSEQDQQEMPSITPQQNGRLNSIFLKNNNSLIENYITYTFEKGQSNISLLAGHSYQKIFVQERWWSIGTFPDNGIEPRYNPGLGQEVLLSGDNNHKPWGTATKYELQSFFGRVNYSLMDRYLLTANIRSDGSSKFGVNNKYGLFPSFSLGWRISEEAFMESLPLSNLMLRAGWGQTGNQEIPAKITQALFTTTVSSSTSYPLTPTGAYPAGTAYVRFANPDIQWEFSTQTNIGLDFGLLKGALTGSVDYFNKVSSDILLQVTPPDPIQPAQTHWTNVEDMTITNKGLELALNYQYQAGNGFRYSVGGNASFIDNIVENSPFTIITSGDAQGSGLTASPLNGYVNGEPIGTFYLPDFAGIDETGMSIYRDIPDTDEDRIAAGSALPTTMYNFFANVGFKGFDFVVNFNGVSGNKIYDNTANANFYKAKLAKSVNTTSEASEFPTESSQNSASISTRYLKDGAYFRLNNVALGYNFNLESLGISEWVTALRVSVTGQNLFLVTDYDGYDPDVNTDRAAGLIPSYGIDYLSYPKARTIVFGLNVSF
jgi:TonB-dependent starch-binding outer membrane protein SusC